MCGCPIICNDVGGNLEIAHDGENAFIANSWNELVCVLNSLLDIPKDDYMAMCAKSREIYLSRFTFDMFKQKIFRTVLNFIVSYYEILISANNIISVF